MKIALDKLFQTLVPSFISLEKLISKHLAAMAWKFNQVMNGRQVGEVWLGEVWYGMVW